MRNKLIKSLKKYWNNVRPVFTAALMILGMGITAYLSGVQGWGIDLTIFTGLFILTVSLTAYVYFLIRKPELAEAGLTEPFFREYSSDLEDELDENDWEGIKNVEE